MKLRELKSGDRFAFNGKIFECVAYTPGREQGADLMSCRYHDAGEEQETTFGGGVEITPMPDNKP